MTKSTITRERLQEIAEDGFLKHGESKELARMALAAMDSESGCLPLDYLQGHKDGLEWAAQLAEANHPETGDWLYDDPIELAKAIRKGPDMPPVQPVADSEPVAWTWQHLKQWYVTNDEERARELAWDGVKVEQLYRHAQPVPVVSADLLHTAASAIEDLLTTKDRTGACVWFDLPFRLRSAANAQPAPVVNGEYGNAYQGAREDLAIWKRRALEAEESVRRLEQINDHLVKEAQGESRMGEPVIARPVPVVPDEMYWQDAPVDGSTRAAAYATGWNACRAAMLAAAPQSPGSDPATVPGKWIPVSERMPDNTEPVLCIEKRADFGTYGQPFVCWHDGGGWVGKTNYRPIVTHWMPLPAAPQEVKSE
ncbi:DUF551 domain-containing protein [Klebsiella pneumoniae]|nr:DUF551 domain-containing protein [Klebsiella pneumoniae]